MSTFYHHALPYAADSSLLFNKIRDLPWPIFLDSCAPFSSQGRYDILAASPFLRVTTQDQQTLITDHQNKAITAEDPFSVIAKLLHDYAVATPADWPLAGGAIGFLSYDLARRFDTLPAIAHALLPIDDMALGFYDWVIINDHHQKRTALLSYLKHPETHQQLPHILERLNTLSSPPSPTFELTKPLISRMDFATYEACFHKIKQYLLAGDCYQVNLAQCFEGAFSGDPYGAFLKLRQKNPAPYSAFLDIKDYQLVSCSPELFIKTQGCFAMTKPIKGTIKRHADPDKDQAAANRLKQSKKDNAENLMIVDLLRNDFGKVCVTGSIKVPQLFEIESFTSIHHLVSSVTGTLKNSFESIALLKACFPGGSITGAPKLRAMQIIEELEPIRRGIYCGSVGYLGFDGQSQFNIAIRTLFFNHSSVYAYAGGAIVYDSQLTSEYEECLHKIAGIIQGLR